MAREWPPPGTRAGFGKVPGIGQGVRPEPGNGGGSNENGFDLVTNGTFDTDTIWTKGSGWAIAAGVATGTATSGDLWQLGALVTGRNYTVTFTVTAFTAGTITPNIGGRSGTARGSAATFTEVIQCGLLNTRLGFGTSTFTGSIDNVTVRQL